MNLNYCPVCGTKLYPKEQPHEAPALYCAARAPYRRDKLTWFLLGTAGGKHDSDPAVW